MLLPRVRIVGGEASCLQEQGEMQSNSLVISTFQRLLPLSVRDDRRVVASSNSSVVNCTCSVLIMITGLTSTYFVWYLDIVESALRKHEIISGIAES